MGPCGCCGESKAFLQFCNETELNGLMHVPQTASRFTFQHRIDPRYLKIVQGYYGCSTSYLSLPAWWWL